MEKIMILGAGRGQLGLIQSAKENGYHTVVASIPGDYPGLALADEVASVDISDPEQVLAEARRLQIDGIATACLDTGIAALGHVCDQMGLPGLSAQAARRSNDKLLMKQAFMNNEVSTAKYQQVASVDELEALKAELTLPLIVKAVDLQGSKGIYIARSWEEARAGFEAAMALTRRDFCIVEEYIENAYELGSQAFVYQGEILFILPAGDYTYMSHTAVPVGHYAPSELPKGLQQQVIEESRKAIRAIGLDNCAVNIDLLIKDGKVYVIELTGRVGANCFPELVAIHYGIDYYKMIVEMAMGKDPRPVFENRIAPPSAMCAKMLLSEQTGTLKRIVNNNTVAGDVREITFFVEPGDQIRKFVSSSDCLGQVIVTGDSLEKSEDLMEQVIQNISFEME